MSLPTSHFVTPLLKAIKGMIKRIYYEKVTKS